MSNCNVEFYFAYCTSQLRTPTPKKRISTKRKLDANRSRADSAAPFEGQPSPKVSTTVLLFASSSFNSLLWTKLIASETFWTDTEDVLAKAIWRHKSHSWERRQGPGAVQRSASRNRSGGQWYPYSGARLEKIWSLQASVSQACRFAGNWSHA